MVHDRSNRGNGVGARRSSRRRRITRVVDRTAVTLAATSHSVGLVQHIIGRNLHRPAETGGARATLRGLLGYSAQRNCVGISQRTYDS